MSSRHALQQCQAVLYPAVGTVCPRAADVHAVLTGDGRPIAVTACLDHGLAGDATTWSIHGSVWVREVHAITTACATHGATWTYRGCEPAARQTPHPRVRDALAALHDLARTA